MIPGKFQYLLSDTGLDTDWEQSVVSLPDVVPFLLPKNIYENGKWANLPSNAIDFVTGTAGLIISDSDLTLLAWHAHRMLFIDKTVAPSDTRHWPLLTSLLGDFGGAFYLLIALSGIPHSRAIHQSRNIPDDIARNTYRDIYVWAQQYHDIGTFKDGRFFHPGQPGCWGLCTRIFPWLLSHLYGHLYRVGRLQYKTGPFRQPMRVYRHRQTGHIRLLIEAGQTFRTDGHYNGSGGIEDSNAWTSTLAETPTQVTGHPIHPSGYVLHNSVTLTLTDWECVLNTGDPILEIHIPEDGPMEFNACGESLQHIIEFFPKHFPEHPFKAICCTSWFLDPIYQKLLSKTSNIVRFQRECYLYPLHSRGNRSGLERIFGSHVHDLANAPHNSSMRIAVLDHLEAGGVLISGGALLFPEHVSAWGTQSYLQQFQ